MSQNTPTPIPLLSGRYRIETRLGEGRLAVVYRAYDERLQRQVLVHMLRKELLDQAPLRQRFLEESHASARRSHQSLLEVFDTGELAGRPFIVTEYVAGRTLRELGALAPEEALLYFRQLVGAVAASQAAGVPHPPISSNNVILVADGHVELVESWLTTPQEVALDLASYRAPERTQGQPATPAAAVYALGLLLFEMLTGRRAIAGDDPRTIAQAHLTARLPTLAEARPSLYVPMLEELLRRATARAPEQRVPNAATLGRELDDLRRAISGETQHLSAPPTRRPALRERVAQGGGRPAPAVATSPSPPSMVAGQPLVMPARAEAPQAAEPPAEIAPPPRVPRPPMSQRAIGMAIVIALFVVVACGAYYGASLAADRLFNLQLPTIDVPGLRQVLPEWITGVVEGSGDVLVVNAPSLNLRSKPGLSGEVVTELPNQARLRKLEGPVTADNVPWIRVRARVDDRDVEGWVSERFVRSESGAAPKAP